MSDPTSTAPQRPAAVRRPDGRREVTTTARGTHHPSRPRGKSRWRKLYTASRRASNFGLRLGLWLLIAFALVAIADAYFTDDYTLGRFEVPAAVAAAGYTSEVVPRHIYDAMVGMQERSRSVRDFRGFSSGGSRGGGVDIQVAGFGVSFESVARRLREVTGRTERVFGGEVTATGDTLRLALRQNGQLLGRYAEHAPADGMDAALDKLFERAALRVYRVTEPYLTAVLLDEGTDAERAEALAIIRALLDSGDEDERPWALLFLGSRSRTIGDDATAERLYREALAEEPRFRLAYNNLFNIYLAAGQTDSMRAIRTRAESLLAEEDRDLLWNMDYSLALADEDHPERLRRFEEDVLARAGDSEADRSRLHDVIQGLLTSGRAARAHELSTAAIERFPLDGTLLPNHVTTSLLLERWDEAEAAIGRFAALETDTAIVRAAEGWLLVGRDSIERGRALLAAATETGELQNHGNFFVPISQLYVAYRSGDTARQRTMVEGMLGRGMPRDIDTGVEWFEGLLDRYGSDDGD